MVRVSQVTEQLLELTLVTRAKHQDGPTPRSACHLRVGISVQMGCAVICKGIDSTIGQIQGRTVGVLIRIKKNVGPIVSIVVSGTSIRF